MSNDPFGIDIPSFFPLFCGDRHLQISRFESTLSKTFLSFSRVLNKVLLSGCSKTLRYKAPEIPRSETYIPVRRNDEG